MARFAMAWAMVHRTRGGNESPETFTAAQSAARHEWGRLLTEPRGGVESDPRIETIDAGGRHRQIFRGGVALATNPR